MGEVTKEIDNQIARLNMKKSQLQTLKVADIDADISHLEACKKAILDAGVE